MSKQKWTVEDEKRAYLENDSRDAVAYATQLIGVASLNIHPSEYSISNLTDDQVFVIGRHEVYQGEHTVSTIDGDEKFPGYSYGCVVCSRGYNGEPDDFDYLEQGTCRSIVTAVKHCILGYIEDEVNGADTSICEDRYAKQLERERKLYYEVF